MGDEDAWKAESSDKYKAQDKRGEDIEMGSGIYSVYHFQLDLMGKRTN